MSIKLSRYVLTYHAYQRSKERISNKVIENIKNISMFMLEIELNNFIRMAESADIEYLKNNMVLFYIPNSDNLYICTKDNIIVTIKKTSISSLYKSI